jgi:dTMP kinase
VHDVLRPALEAGEVVITDRFVDSSLAYQGAGRTIPLDEIRSLSRWATHGLVPDLTVLLDLPPEVGLARARGRSVADRLESESLEFHQRVRQTFRALAEAEPDRYLVVDARLTPDEIAGEIRRRVAELLSGLQLQTLSGTRRETEKPAGPAPEQPAPPAPAPSTKHHPHAQTGPTPQLHP